MLEIDFFLLLEFVFGFLVIWGLFSQVIIPLRTHRPLFPFFMKRSERVVEEIERMRQYELEREIERAHSEEKQAKLEADLFEARKHADEVRKDVLRRQKQ